ncbi:gluconokinase [Tieghemostelium lacteum]|uniref:Gluconokinase n=1 Tax=Tieghemostelium lacteum TaxID=361077 RepID=A0A151Z5L1_TIELA|nr:gluconokinase [Tieghemostelium lacteum]|eukprot:KYQ89225.1 gluconokinase [Tieghemostelium lacteum]
MEKVILLMGVSGSGKTSIGMNLSQHLKCGFNDADEYHSQANKDKMSSGIALTDEDRLPWLQTIHQRIVDLLSSTNSINSKYHVLTCSALKQQYRDILSKGIDKDKLLIVHLHGSKELIAQRLVGRNHFFNPKLLDSQFDTLEIPSHQPSNSYTFYKVEISNTIEEIVKLIIHDNNLIVHDNN